MPQAPDGEIGRLSAERQFRLTAVRPQALPVGGHGDGGIQTAQALMDGKEGLPAVAELSPKELKGDEVQQKGARQELSDAAVPRAADAAHPQHGAKPVQGRVGLCQLPVQGSVPELSHPVEGQDHGGGVVHGVELPLDPALPELVEDQVKEERRRGDPVESGTEEQSQQGEDQRQGTHGSIEDQHAPAVLLRGEGESQVRPAGAAQPPQDHLKGQPPLGVPGHQRRQGLPLPPGLRVQGGGAQKVVEILLSRGGEPGIDPPEEAVQVQVVPGGLVQQKGVPPLGAAVVEIGPDIAHVLGEVVGVRHAAIVPLQPAPQVTLAHGGSFLRWVRWSDSPLRRPRWQEAPPW